MGGLNDVIADDLRAHAVDLLRYDAGLRRRILKILSDLEQDLIRSLTQIDPTGPARIRYQRERLERLLTQVRDIIAGGYRDIDTLLARELRELAAIEAGFVNATLNRAVKVQLADAVLTGEQLKSIVSDVLIQGAPSKDWWKRQAAHTTERFSDEMRQGMVAGESIGQLVDRVRGGVDESGVSRPGFMDVQKRHAEALVRSSVQTVANDARLSAYRANQDIIKGVQQISTMDGKTTDICLAYSGKSWTLDGEPIGHGLPFNGGPPRHWNCRSTLTPILRSFKELTGLDIPEPPKSTRSSMDGQVAEDLDMADWLRGKPKSFVDDLLGPGRAQLFLDGKITLTDLVDQRGRPWTLEQLERKAA